MICNKKRCLFQVNRSTTKLNAVNIWQSWPGSDWPKIPDLHHCWTMWCYKPTTICCLTDLLIASLFKVVASILILKTQHVRKDKDVIQVFLQIRNNLLQKSVISWLWGFISDWESAGMSRESCVSKRNSTLMNMWINDEEDKKIMGDRDGREGRKWG